MLFKITTIKEIEVEARTESEAFERANHGTHYGRVRTYLKIAEVKDDKNSGSIYEEKVI